MSTQEVLNAELASPNPSQNTPYHASNAAPAKSGSVVKWLLIGAAVVFVMPVVLLVGAVVCIGVIGAIGSSANDQFDAVSAELNQVNHVSETAPVQEPVLDVVSQNDDAYDPFDL